VDIDKGADNPNNQNKPDFWVQAFRNEGIPESDTNDRPVAFDLGVRVYRFYEGQTPSQIKRASLGFTTADGSQRNKPLVTLYSRVILSDTQNSQSKYKQLIDANIDPSCPQ
ncbi:MAG: hypothetical protein WBV73_21290, partial [Phormidium sp.]